MQPLIKTRRRYWVVWLGWFLAVWLLSWVYGLPVTPANVGASQIALPLVDSVVTHDPTRGALFPWRRQGRVRKWAWLHHQAAKADLYLAALGGASGLRSRGVGGQRRAIVADQAGAAAGDRLGSQWAEEEVCGLPSEYPIESDTRSRPWGCLTDVTTTTITGRVRLSFLQS